MSRKHEKRSVSDKNQSSSQTKGFINSLVQKTLEPCERAANKFLHPGANYTYMYNLHTVCKSAHVNGALVAFYDHARDTEVHILDLIPRALTGGRPFRNFLLWVRCLISVIYW